MPEDKIILEQPTDKGLQYRLVSPPTFGWIEIQLDEGLLAHLWNCVNVAGDKHNAKTALIGHVDGSYFIDDIDSILWNNLLCQCCMVYGDTWGCPFMLPIAKKEDKDFILYLEKMWVNYQSKHDFNPLHNHNGVYSFVIWMNLPTEHDDQAKMPNVIDTTVSWNSDFAMHYTDSLGRFRAFKYEMGKQWEGKMLFFPSAMNHEVYPFFECDEQRITISGNVSLKDARDMTEAERTGKPAKYKSQFQ